MFNGKNPIYQTKTDTVYSYDGITTIDKDTGLYWDKTEYQKHLEHFDDMWFRNGREGDHYVEVVLNDESYVRVSMVTGLLEEENEKLKEEYKNRGGEFCN